MVTELYNTEIALKLQLEEQIQETRSEADEAEAGATEARRSAFAPADVRAFALAVGEMVNTEATNLLAALTWERSIPSDLYRRLVREVEIMQAEIAMVVGRMVEEADKKDI